MCRCELNSNCKIGVFKAVTMKTAVFWDVAACRSCVNRPFGGKCRLHLQGRKIRERGASVSKWLQSVADFSTLKMEVIRSSETSAHKIYTAPHPRRRHSLYSNCSEQRPVAGFCNHGLGSPCPAH
jgi:hypothetical protein